MYSCKDCFACSVNVISHLIYSGAHVAPVVSKIKLKSRVFLSSNIICVQLGFVQDKGRKIDLDVEGENT